MVPASQVGADTCFTFQIERGNLQTGESSKPAHDVEAWVGAGGASLEFEAGTWIYQADAKRLLLIDHTAKTYQVFPIPFSVLDYQPEDQREQFRDFLLSLAPQTRLEGPGDIEAVGERRVRRWVATVTTTGGGSFLIEAWISPELGDRCAMLERLWHARSALDSLYGEAERQILDVPGCMVRKVVRKTSRNGAITTTETRLVAIREVPSEPGRYAPPADYHEVPVDRRLVGGFFPAQPLPTQ